MNELVLPWLEFVILIPLLGAVVCSRLRSEEARWKFSSCASGLVFLGTMAAWIDFGHLNVFEAHDHWDFVQPYLGNNLVVIDEFSAPLMSLASLLYFLTPLATARSKRARFPFALTLLSESLLLALLSCRLPWGVIALLGAQNVLPVVELRQRRQPPYFFLLYMLTSLVLVVLGWLLIDFKDLQDTKSILAIVMVSTGLLIRCGCVPTHSWMADLFERASLGTALLFITPMAGAYCMVRLVLPIAPDWILRAIALSSLFTALYASGLALVQVDARRFFCYLFLSNTSLMLVGLEIATAVGLTGSLCIWLSVGISLAAFGTTLRALESRVGRLTLDRYHGLYERMPALAGFFLLAGLASIGFPGTIGFIGTELLVEGVLDVYSHVEALVVIVAALNGIAAMKAYFRLFTGSMAPATISMQPRIFERAFIVVYSLLILVGGFYPQPGVTSRYHAANEIMQRRAITQAIDP